jgi:hypothetical protein
VKAGFSYSTEVSIVGVAFQRPAKGLRTAGSGRDDTPERMSPYALNVTVQIEPERLVNFATGATDVGSVKLLSCESDAKSVCVNYPLFV